MMTNALSSLSSIDANVLAGSVLRWLGLSLVYGTLLAAFTWVVLKTAFRKSGLLFAGAIWTVVLLKFIIPAGPGIPFSLATLTDSIRQSVNSDANAPTFMGKPAAANSDVQFITIFENGAAPAAIAGAAPSPANWSTLIAMATAYVALLIAITLWRGYRYAAVVRRCRGLRRAEREIDELVVRTCHRHGIHRSIDVRVSDEASAPFVVGLFRPMLVLSPRHLADTVEAEAVILHEIGHVRPFDVVLRCLQCLVGTLLFFWPVVAWVNRRIDLAREHACDDWALSHGKLSAAEYARCLLRALQPVRSSWSIYSPAAMAANRRHVERRIEMILQHPDRSRHARSLGVGALLVVGAWAVFTLSGSKPADAAIATDDVAAVQSDTGTKKIIVTRVNQSGDGQMQVNVVRMNNGDVQISEDGTARQFQWVASNGGNKSKAMAFVASGDAPHCVMAASFAGIDEESLARFAADHPAADLNADGKVSPREREAYLTAVASLAPAAVLQKFPHADKNSDSALDLNEAAQLVSGGDFDIRLPQSGQPHMIAFAGKAGGAWQAADGPCQIICEEAPVECKVICVTPGDEDENCNEIIVSGAKTNGKNVELKVDCDVEVAVEAEGATADKNVFVVRANPGDAAAGAWTQKIEGQPMRVAVRMNNALAEFTPAAPLDDVATWLTENVIVVPTPAQLRDAMTAVEAAPLVQFKNLHPEADTNNDGNVSVEERDAFLANEMKNVHKKILEQFPEADANKDGEMTEAEMHEFFKARAGTVGFGAASVGQPGQLKDKMIFIGDAQPASYTVECKPVQCQVIVQTKDSNEEAKAEATATTERP